MRKLGKNGGRRCQKKSWIKIMAPRDKKASLGKKDVQEEFKPWIITRVEGEERG